MWRINKALSGQVKDSCPSPVPENLYLGKWKDYIFYVNKRLSSLYVHVYVRSSEWLSFVRSQCVPAGERE